VSTPITASLEPRRLWIRVLKRVQPNLTVDDQDRRRSEANDAYEKGDEVLLRSVLATTGPPSDPWKTWAQAQPATPLQSSYQPPLLPLQPPTAPEVFAVLWAACAVLCLLLYGILATLKEIAGRIACLSLLLLLTAALMWLIAKNSKLTSNHKTKWLGAVAGVVTLIGICLLNTSRATPLLLSAQAVAAPTQVKDTDPVRFMNAHPLQSKLPPAVTPLRLPRGETPASQLAGYIAGVRDTVAQKWNLSEITASTPAGATVYIQFAVRRRGSHEVPTVETSSGSTSLDASCVRAVNRTQSFGHFPMSYTGDSLTVLYHCTYPGPAAGSPGTKLAQDSILPAQQATPRVPVDAVPGSRTSAQ
jgi:drug/metabolite transporter superfamily protein YnfA